MTLYLKSCRYSRGDSMDKIWRSLMDSNIVDIERIERHSVALRNGLITFCGERGDIVFALDVLNGILESKTDIVSINAAMKCLVDNGQSVGAIALYRDHLRFNGLEVLEQSFNDEINGIHGIKSKINADERSLVLLLTAVLRTKWFNLPEIQSVIAEIERNIKSKRNLLTVQSTILLNTLIAIHGERGDTDAAEHIFDGMTVSKKDGVTLSVMMRCYIEQKQPRYHRAIELYESMKRQIDRNESSTVLMLKCCIKTRDFERAQSVIEEYQRRIRNGSRCSSKWLNSLISFYSEFGDIGTAEQHFKSINQLVQQ